MKTIYIPKGETVSYESLETERLVVRGCLKVAYGVHARSIIGNGYLDAQTIYADDIRAREIEAGSVICKRLIAERVQTPELIAGDSAVVSTFLSAAYVKAGKLTVAVSEVDTVEADEVVNLRPKKRGLLWTLILSSLMSLWFSFKGLFAGPDGKEKNEDGDVEAQSGVGTGPAQTEDDPVRAQVAKTVREIMAENGFQTGDGDAELKRVVSSFLLLRDQGYTLRVLPGTPEENAPYFDFNAGRIVQPAA